MSDYEQMTDDELRAEIARRLRWAELHPAKRMSIHVPNWPQDCNAAMELTKTCASIGLSWNSIQEEWTVRFYDWGVTDIRVTDDVPARAISIAWLIWQDAQKGEAEPL